MSRGRDPPKQNLQAIARGCDQLCAHPFFGRLTGARWSPSLAGPPFPKDGSLRLRVEARPEWGGAAGRRSKAAWTIEANPWRRLAPEEWANLLGQALLHVHLNHLDTTRGADPLWQTACELTAADFLRLLHIGTRPPELPYPEGVPGRDAEEVARALEAGGADLPASFRGIATLAGSGQPTWTILPGTPPFEPKVLRERTETLATAIRNSVSEAIETAGRAGRGPATARRDPNSMAEGARSWFVASYPLLAALAAGFEIVEDERTCEAHDIAVAAVNAEEHRVFINPRFPWTEGGMRFVMAHELLHVGLRHEPRRQGRDPYLWTSPATT